MAYQSMWSRVAGYVSDAWGRWLIGPRKGSVDYTDRVVETYHGDSDGYRIGQVKECSRGDGHTGPCNGWPCATARAAMAEADAFQPFAYQEVPGSTVVIGPETCDHCDNPVMEGASYCPEHAPERAYGRPMGEVEWQTGDMTGAGFGVTMKSMVKRGDTYVVDGSLPDPSGVIRQAAAVAELLDLSGRRFVAGDVVLREVDVLQDRLRDAGVMGEGSLLVVSVELRKMCQRLKLTP